MNTLSTNRIGNLQTAQWGLAFAVLLAVPLILAGCDSNGNGNGGEETNASPTAAFTFSGNTDDDPLSVDFDASESSDPDDSVENYSWEFGDGSQGEGETTSHTYSGDGDYDVTLTVKDTAGNSDKITQTVSISTAEAVADSRQRWENGDLVVENTAFYNFGAGSSVDTLVNLSVGDNYSGDPETQDNQIESQFQNGNSNASSNFSGNVFGTDPGLTINRSQGGTTLDPRPTNQSSLPSPTPKSEFAVAGSGDGVQIGQIEDVSYHGAFDPNASETWLKGWTALSQLGYTDNTGVTQPDENLTEVVVTDDITSNTTWSNDNVYVLNGLVFVDGAKLTIESGTVIKARQQSSITGEDQGRASALIVRSNATIQADGSADNNGDGYPDGIIFTTKDDDVSDPNDIANPNEQRGLWGGVILLGNASTNQPTSNNQVEGVPDGEAALYGGSNDDFDIGTFRYVSIRHGGFSISGVSGDEINGLTMGALGRNSTVDHVEVFANFDDGFEWFGGTVHTSHLVAAFCGDDGFDYDQGFRGTGQFWATVQNPDAAGRSGEHDSGDAAGDAATPIARPVISNATYIGGGTGNISAGNSPAILFRDNAGGEYYNSIVTSFPNKAIGIEDLQPN